MYQFHKSKYFVAICIYLTLYHHMNKQMKESKKDKRMSLDPTIHKHLIQKVYGATQIEVKSIIEESHSKSIITNNNNQEQYTLQQLEFIFEAISKGKGMINCKDLYGLLQEEGYGDSLYNAVQMIALVDTTRKGYITQEEFYQFFTDKNYNTEEKIPPLPQHMKKDREWIKAMETNPEFFKHFQEKKYVQFVSRQYTKYKQRNQ